MQEIKDGHLNDLSYIVDRLILYYTPSEVRAFLTSPQHTLNGEKPIQLIRQGRWEEVVDAIDQLDYGNYI